MDRSSDLAHAPGRARDVEGSVVPRLGTKLANVADQIVSQIEAGRLREGDRLPSEQQLAADSGVSLGTVQKALTQLAHRGLIQREHGRGTFVSGSKLAPADTRFLRFRNARGMELPLYVTVMGTRRLRQRGPWSQFLADAGEWVRIDRRIVVGTEHVLASEFFLGAAEFKALGARAALGGDRNLRELLQRRLALPTLRVDQLIRFEPLPARPARVLELEAGATGFVMELKGYTLRERPLYYQRLYSGPFSSSLVIVR